MSVEQHVGLTGERLIAAFQTGHVLMEGIKNASDEAANSKRYLDSLTTFDRGAVGLERYRAHLEQVDPQECVAYLEQLSTIAQMKAILSVEQKKTTALTGGLAADIRAKDAQNSPIFSTQFWSNRMTGAKGYDVQKSGIPEVSGEIRGLSLADNYLCLNPRKFTLGRLDMGYYETPVLDANGFPLITLTLRRAAFMEKTGNSIVERLIEM